MGGVQDRAALALALGIWEPWAHGAPSSLQPVPFPWGHRPVHDTAHGSWLRETLFGAQDVSCLSQLGPSLPRILLSTKATCPILGPICQHLGGPSLASLGCGKQARDVCVGPWPKPPWEWAGLSARGKQNWAWPALALPWPLPCHSPGTVYSVTATMAHPTRPILGPPLPPCRAVVCPSSSASRCRRRQPTRMYRPRAPRIKGTT